MAALNSILYHRPEIPMTRSRALLVSLVLLAGACAFAQRPPIQQQLTFTPYHADGIYKLGETVGWTVTPGPDAPTYAYKWTIRRNNAVILKEGKLDLTSGNDKIEIVGDQPAMIYVAIEPYANLDTGSPAPNAAASTTAPANPAATSQGIPARDAATTSAAQSGSTTPAQSSPALVPAWKGGNTGRNNGLYAVGAAVAPLQIPLSTPRPDDFDSFWDGKLALQAKVPINPSTHSCPDRCARC